MTLNRSFLRWKILDATMRASATSDLNRKRRHEMDADEARRELAIADRLAALTPEQLSQAKREHLDKAGERHD